MLIVKSKTRDNFNFFLNLIKKKIPCIIRTILFLFREKLRTLGPCEYSFSIWFLQMTLHALVVCFDGVLFFNCSVHKKSRLVLVFRVHVYEGTIDMHRSNVYFFSGVGSTQIKKKTLNWNYFSLFRNITFFL